MSTWRMARSGTRWRLPIPAPPPLRAARPCRAAARVLGRSAAGDHDLGGVAALDVVGEVAAALPALEEVLGQGLDHPRVVAGQQLLALGRADEAGVDHDAVGVV